MNVADQILYFMDGGKRWGQGQYVQYERGHYPRYPIASNPDGLEHVEAACLLGSISLLEGGHRYGYDRTDPRQAHLEAVIEQAIHESFPLRWHLRWSSVVGFNDHSKTTWPMVEKVLKRASKILDKQNPPVQD